MLTGGNIYRPQTKFAKFMFLHVSVILSTGGGLQAHTQGGWLRGLAGGSPGPYPGGGGWGSPGPYPGRRLGVWLGGL